MKEPKRVGIIGCGARGLHHIGFNMIDDVDQTELLITAVNNRSLESADYAATELENRYRTLGREVSVSRCTTYQELLADPS
ncbi:MAG: hypothetical protein AAGC74_14560, partial [Verrucomicrobiota bacterium]